MRNLKLGDIVKLKQDLLGNDEGAQGVVFQEYIFAGELPGVQVIFENGEYDGFSDAEQKVFFERVGTEPSLTKYEFVNVAKVCQDFDAGVFDVVFN